jgi:predicted RNA binding protein YcfA (HicA-like mRNA interferase family)
MPKLPCVSGVKVAKALERMGFHRQRQRGSRLVMHREIDRGTLRGVLRQAGVLTEEFIEQL